MLIPDSLWLQLQRPDDMAMSSSPQALTLQRSTWPKHCSKRSVKGGHPASFTRTMDPLVSKSGSRWRSGLLGKDTDGMVWSEVMLALLDSKVATTETRLDLWTPRIKGYTIQLWTGTRAEESGFHHPKSKFKTGKSLYNLPGTNKTGRLTL